MERKAQAAMEFLMTYGWAILAAIVVIGALGTYFYFRTGTTDSAFVNPPLYALGSAISTGSGVQLELKNNGADDITITSVAITPKTTGVTCTADATSTPVPAGNATTRTVGCLGLTAGKGFKGDIAVSYQKSGSTLTLQSSGSVSGTIA